MQIKCIFEIKWKKVLQSAIIKKKKIVTFITFVAFYSETNVQIVAWVKIQQK